MTSASDIMRFLRRFGASAELGSAFFATSISNSLQKSSAIQKISVTLLSVIMIQYLLFDTSKLLNISEIAKRIGDFFKLPIQLFYSISYPELALPGKRAQNVVPHQALTLGGGQNRQKRQSTLGFSSRRSPLLERVCGFFKRYAWTDTRLRAALLNGSLI